MKFGAVDVFYIPYTMRETGTGMTSKALFITSDQDISVYAVNKEQYSADAFLALPIDVLGKEYYASRNLLMFTLSNLTSRFSSVCTGSCYFLSYFSNSQFQ